MALGEYLIDAASFTTLRLGSGAVMLMAIAAISHRKNVRHLKVGWNAAIMLFLYAIAFSFSYLQLSAGTGALLLFGSVQVTMILVALKQGEKPQPLEWLGLCVASIGLIYLIWPGIAAPPIVGSIFMIVAGIAWGLYTLFGRGIQSPLDYTTVNFMRAALFAVGVSLLRINTVHITLSGMILALLSGALASGLGYTIWYAALKGLTATRAATVQLAVPAIAAIGGVLFLQEILTPRLIVASLTILGGISLAICGRKSRSKDSSEGE
ncbi:MAG: DMT family transporter [Cyanobacteria bacterium J06642_2]